MNSSLIGLSFYFLLTPHPGVNPEYATTYLHLRIAQDLNPFYLLIGEAFNPHGDYAPVIFNAVHNGGVYKVVGLSALDTSHEVPFRGYYILSSTWEIDDETFNGVGFNGNADLNYSHEHNDYSSFNVDLITKDEYIWASQMYGVPIAE